MSRDVDRTAGEREARGPAPAEKGRAERFPEQVQFVSMGEREVSALLVRPPEPVAILAFAHGAGAGIDHPFMTDMSQRLARRGVATLRYNFPYMEERLRSGGRRRPDRPPVLVDTVRAAVERAALLSEGVPLLAGGKSLGGRMTSTAASEAPLAGVTGIVFFGFPLHAPGRPSSHRAEHLARVEAPMLFLQGTRDSLADLEHLRPVCESLGERAMLHVVEGADHSFRTLKKSGRTGAEVAEELAARVAAWVEELD